MSSSFILLFATDCIYAKTKRHYKLEHALIFVILAKSKIHALRYTIKLNGKKRFKILTQEVIFQSNKTRHSPKIQILS